MSDLDNAYARMYAEEEAYRRKKKRKDLMRRRLRWSPFYQRFDESGYSWHEIRLWPAWRWLAFCFELRRNPGKSP